MCMQIRLGPYSVRGLRTPDDLVRVESVLDSGTPAGVAGAPDVRVLLLTVTNLIASQFRGFTHRRGRTA
jgi:hypothetical protein